MSDVGLRKDPGLALLLLTAVVRIHYLPALRA